jgi:hypothetical protein
MYFLLFLLDEIYFLRNYTSIYNILETLAALECDKDTLIIHFSKKDQLYVDLV